MASPRRSHHGVERSLLYMLLAQIVDVRFKPSGSPRVTSTAGVVDTGSIARLPVRQSGNRSPNSRPVVPKCGTTRTGQPADRIVHSLCLRIFQKSCSAPSRPCGARPPSTKKTCRRRCARIRLALLEADVNFKVVKQLIDQIQDKAVGQQVVTALSPGRAGHQDSSATN